MHAGCSPSAPSRAWARSRARPRSSRSASPRCRSRSARWSGELGTALLVRGRGGAVPTEAGRLLLEHADAVADAARRSPTSSWARSSPTCGARCASARSPARSPRSCRRRSPRSARSSRTSRSRSRRARWPRSPRACARAGSTWRSASRTRPRRRATTAGCGARSSPRSGCSPCSAPATGSPAASGSRWTELRDDPWMAPSRDGLVVERLPRRGLRAEARPGHPRPARRARARRGRAWR